MQINWKIIQDNAKVLGIPLTVFESNIFDTVATLTKIHVISVQECAEVIFIHMRRSLDVIRLH